jgi:hypothetical protein
MKFRNYCAVIMGDFNSQEVLAEILKVTETEPNTLDANGIIIITFTSVAEPRELTDYFKENKRNFVIFDMNTEYSGYHIMKKNINDGLFGSQKNLSDDTLKERMNGLIHEISSSTVTNKVQTKDISDISEIKITSNDISKMSMNDKNNLINKILTKDGKNLSDYDKELLGLLSD